MFLLSLQIGYTKYQCSPGLWGRRVEEKNWKEDKWPLRDPLKVEEHNITKNEPLDDRESIIFQPLNVKFDWLKQFTTALNIVMSSFIRDYQPSLRRWFCTERHAWKILVCDCPSKFLRNKKQRIIKLGECYANTMLIACLLLGLKYKHQNSLSAVIYAIC